MTTVWMIEFKARNEPTQRCVVRGTSDYREAARIAHKRLKINRIAHSFEAYPIDAVAHAKPSEPA